jgi:hypothetical protein
VIDSVFYKTRLANKHVMITICKLPQEIADKIVLTPCKFLIYFTRCKSCDSQHKCTSCPSNFILSNG